MFSHLKFFSYINFESIFSQLNFISKFVSQNEQSTSSFKQACSLGTLTLVFASRLRTFICPYFACQITFLWLASFSSSFASCCLTLHIIGSCLLLITHRLTSSCSGLNCCSTIVHLLSIICPLACCLVSGCLTSCHLTCCYLITSNQR